MLRPGLAVAFVASSACWRGHEPEPVPSQPAPEAELVMSESGVGPFNASTVATLQGVRTSAPAYVVRTHDLGAGAGIVYNVYRERERLFYVVPDDAPGWTDDSELERQYANTVFAVFAVSPRVRVDGRTWRVGEPLPSADGLAGCWCWGNHDVAACYQPGSHIRVIFEQPCDEAEETGPRAMVGKRIARLMWKRELEPEDVTPPE